MDILGVDIGGSGIKGAVVGYLINLTITQLLNLVPVAGEVYVRTPREVFLVDDVKVQTEFNTSVLHRTYIEG